MSKIHRKTNKICSICCDEITDDGILLHKTRRQTHILCCDCGQGYLSPLIKQKITQLRNNIKLNKTYIFPCSGSYHSNIRNNCNCNIIIGGLHINNTIELYKEYIRLYTLLYFPDCYPCQTPECNNIIHSTTSELKCVDCDKSWCKFCLKQPYHIGMNCTEYDINITDSSDSKLINKMNIEGELKYCPQCNFATIKEKDEHGNYTGCMKITCGLCQTTWCWLCGQINIDYSHYNSDLPSSCSNKLWKGTIHKIV